MIKHVLIVDDDVDDCDLFSDAVTIVDSDVAVEQAHSARAALSLLRTDYKPDFIFLDLNMAGIDGMDCLVEIRKIESLLQVPIIIYTTSKRKDDEKKSQILGANHFLTKPHSLNELCAEISFMFLNNWDTAFESVTHR